MATEQGGRGHDVPPPARARVEEALGGGGDSAAADNGSNGGGAATERSGEARGEPPAVATAAPTRAARRSPGRHAPEHERRDVRNTMLRTAALLLGTLVLATAFVAAYVGALHRPTPRELPVGVARDDAPARTLLDALRHAGDEIKPREYADRRAAAEALTDGKVYAVLASTDVAGTSGLTLSTASAAGPPAAAVIVGAVTAAAQATQVPVTVVDAVPVTDQDPRGLVPFYLAIGLVLGGYLGSTVLALSAGAVPRGPPGVTLRIGGLALFAVLLGVAAALVVGPGLGIWSDHLAGLAAAGALIVFAAAMTAAAVQSWLGLLGTGLVILLVVVLGNPGSGGIYPPEFLPALFRSMHRWNLPGLGTELIRALVYFGREATTWPVVALAIWAVGGMAVLLGATAAFGRAARRQ